MRYASLTCALLLAPLGATGGLRTERIVPLTPMERDTVSARDSAIHALNRLAYGPTPGEVDRVASFGVMRWVDAQLEPGKINDEALAPRERALPVLSYSREALARVYADAARERREAAMGANTMMADSEPAPGPHGRLGRALTDQYVELTLIRAALSQRQLYEVMVDFWTNHFNVLIAKGADRFLLPDYIEHTIRPHAFGRFSDLLGATAESPAMLFYLDNWESVAPGARPPGWRYRFGVGGADSARRARAPRGLNENYARELLELHTLGVDGGYTQQDVVNVARIFTGWSIERPERGGGFQFHDWAHDWGSKVVLGMRFPAGHGQDEGVRLLRWLANAPATMHHVSRALCQRFVRDDPPDGCVDDAVAAWQRSGGDIGAVLRAIVNGADFWAPANRAAKVKTPLVFLVSALRVTGAQPDSSLRLPQVAARLGEPLFMHAAPDGYPESAAAWVNSGALLDRMNVAVALAADRLPGARVDLDVLLGDTPDPAELVAAVDAKVLAGTMTDNTTRVIEDEVSTVPNPVAARALAVGLAIGGPEFQRQ
ncbi:MAG TPA: DUF1800 domain-containing protein [Gemmatimonadales bacterium]|nr:DUF1800 domain-containing protein [Gemmatimonadales bacterium]